MREFRELDAAAAKVAGSQGVFDLALGETLHLLFRGTRLMKLSYSSERDYARERLGTPVRTMRAWLALARACAGRPLLRKAVTAALVSPCKARALAPVIADDEAAWTTFAMTSTLREIEVAVRAAGKDPPEEFESESFVLRMSPPQQDRLEAALALAKETIGGVPPEWQCLEAMAMEWLGEHGGSLAPEEEGAGEPQPLPKPLGKALAEHLAAIAEARAAADAESPATEKPKELDALALRLIEGRRRFDEIFGPLALRIVDDRVWAALGYESLEEYCAERLGMSERAIKERAWLERRMLALQGLRDALCSGRLSYSKALLVAREANPSNIAELIERAAGTTWQQSDREATARQKQRDRARGVRRLWGPKDAMKTVADAILSAQEWSERQGRRIDAGEALATIADHCVSVWSAHRAKPKSPLRREVLTRHGGYCAVPGCSRAACHVHHVTFRSQGGTDDSWNQVGLCAWHHLYGIHHGFLNLEGRAGERLVWRFGTGEVFVTYGDDDVRRADAAGADRVGEPAPPAYAAAHRRAPAGRAA